MEHPLYDQVPPSRQSRFAHFRMGGAILFSALALAAGCITAFLSEYSYGLLFMTAAAGFTALPFFCGGGKAAAAGAAGLLSVGVSLLLFPAKPWFALFIAAFFCMSAVLAFGARKGWTRTKFTALGALTLALVLAAGFFLYLGLRFGGVGMTAINAFREGIVRQFSDTVNSINEMYAASLQEIGGESSLSVLESLPTAAEVLDTVGEMARVSFLMMPGLLMALCCCLAHFAASLFLLLGRRYGELLLPEERRGISIAWPGAVLFYFGALAAVFGGESVLGMTGQNFYLLYLPGFVYMGFRETFSKERLHRPGGYFIPVLLGLSLLLSPAMVPMLLALFGASKSIREALQKRIAEKNGRPGGGGQE